MARNDCPCPCHSDSHCDFNFSCGLCYSANHMSHLNKKQPQQPKRPKATVRKSSLSGGKPHKLKAGEAVKENAGGFLVNSEAAEAKKV